MKIVVCVKQVAVVGDELEFEDGERAIDADYIDWSLNEWDAYAVEEALQLREAHGGLVIAISAGGPEAEGGLRRALAMGVDEAVCVRPSAPDTLSVAAAIASVPTVRDADLVLAGAQSSDAVQAAVGSALAAHLGLPCVAVATRIDWAASDRVARVVRELEGGLQELLEVQLPAVVTVQTGINQPRYANLRAIKQAETREILELAGPDVAPAFTILRLFAPPKADGAEMLDGSTPEIAKQILELVREGLS